MRAGSFFVLLTICLSGEEHVGQASGSGAQRTAGITDKADVADGDFLFQRNGNHLFLGKRFRSEFFGDEGQTEVVNDNRQHQIGAGQLNVIMKREAVRGEEVFVKTVGHCRGSQSGKGMLPQIMQGIAVAAQSGETGASNEDCFHRTESGDKIRFFDL